MTSLVRSGGFGHLLYTTGGKSAAMKDIPKLLSLGWEVDTLEVSDPMPGTDHIEVRIHFSRSTLGTANISAHAALLSELAIAAGGSGPLHEKCRRFYQIAAIWEAEPVAHPLKISKDRISEISIDKVMIRICHRLKKRTRTSLHKTF
eukprot:TRINITY_DN9184_c0_g1_i1.p1 TRINITY_DN9184_c0_g1~~TRINITY_DN9184_c0_g1_i1.p1  ORF type:complete len:147 (+),score=10.69 TRINITY_DN9184_c0_g1_i1:202-642(+)